MKYFILCLALATAVDATAIAAAGALSWTTAATTLTATSADKLTVEFQVEAGNKAKSLSFTFKKDLIDLTTVTDANITVTGGASACSKITAGNGKPAKKYADGTQQVEINQNGSADEDLVSNHKFICIEITGNWVLKKEACDAEFVVVHADNAGNGSASVATTATAVKSVANTTKAPCKFCDTENAATKELVAGTLCNCSATTIATGGAAGLCESKTSALMNCNLKEGEAKASTAKYECKKKEGGGAESSTSAVVVTLSTLFAAILTKRFF